MVKNIDKLINDFFAGSISEKEKNLLENWVKENRKNKTYFESKVKDFATTKNDVQINTEEAFKKFIVKTNIVKTPKNIWFKYAAVLILLISTGIFITLNQDKAIPEAKVVENIATQNDDGQITITLADGSKKIINKSGSFEITDEEGNVVANTKNGAIVFNNSSPDVVSETPVYSEIYIPYGQKFNIQLTDGTKVWLNSGSRLKFAQNLDKTEGERLVFLEGEAYFDVAKNASRPFIVKTGDLDVQVLGTKFNVSSYMTDKQIATTLVEGSVKVLNNENPNDELLLTPSQQALFKKQVGQLSKKQVDTSLYTAWMDNRIIVNGLSFPEILERLERFYNVDIESSAQNLNNYKYKGEFENADLESVLAIMAISTPFNFKIKANEVTITE